VEEGANALLAFVFDGDKGHFFGSVKEGLRKGKRDVFYAATAEGFDGFAGLFRE
jgi:hypothetical protein